MVCHSSHHHQPYQPSTITYAASTQVALHSQAQQGNPMLSSLKFTQCFTIVCEDSNRENYDGTKIIKLDTPSFKDIVLTTFIAGSRNKLLLMLLYISIGWPSNYSSTITITILYLYSTILAEVVSCPTNLNSQEQPSQIQQETFPWPPSSVSSIYTLSC